MTNLTLVAALTAAQKAWLDEDGSFLEAFTVACDTAIATGDDDTAEALYDLWTTAPDDPVAVLAQLIATVEADNGPDPS